MAHRITIHTLHFLKLYLIYCYETTNQLPIVNHVLIINIMKTVAQKQTKRGAPVKNITAELRGDLERFFIQHYKVLMSIEDLEELNYTHMTTILEYLATNIETVYMNNVKQHFVTYVERYINVIADKKARLKEIENSSHDLLDKKIQIAQLCTLLKYIKTDILNLTGSDLLSPFVYHDFIIQTRSLIIPTKKSYKQNSLYYDLQCYPQEYMVGMLRMMKEIEKKNATLMNLFPVRSNSIPKYIKIDTTILHRLIY